MFYAMHILFWTSNIIEVNTGKLRIIHGFCIKLSEIKSFIKK